MKRFNLKNKKGFTLLEALVAVSILMVAVSAPITIAQKGLSSAVYSKDQMIASYLVQDAIEYIKNKRDEASINDPSFNWDSLWSPMSECLTANGCQIDTVNQTNTVFAYVDPGTFLKKDIDGFYQYQRDNCVTGDCVTRFTRQVQITKRSIDGREDEALVKVTVRWADNSVEVNTLIYNY